TRKGVMQDPDRAALPQADNDRLSALIAEEVWKRAATMRRKVAEGSVDPYTLDQLNDILTLSKIKFFQDLMLAGGDPSLASPGNDVITPAERDVLAKADSKPYINDFLNHMDFAALRPDGTAAVNAALQRYVMEKSGKAG
ncbi:MAG: hypothetical protein ACXU8U_09265, partial [Asticcacaulis sp.]